MYMSEPTGEYVFMEDQQKAYQEVADKLGIGLESHTGRLPGMSATTLLKDTAMGECSSAVMHHM